MKESEIRNTAVLDKYLGLVEKDVKNLFDFKMFKQINCPACGSSDFMDEFKKIGFQYVTCRVCSTLFVNPRPSFEILSRFYAKSASTDFWVNEFFRPQAENRREKIFKPRAEYLIRILNGSKNIVIGDIGAGFGIFLEELRKLAPDNHYVAIEPSWEMSEICRKVGLKTKCMYLEDIKEPDEGFDILTAFELLEHLSSPAYFLKKVYALLKPGGKFFLTTLNGKGFDILLLWEKSKSISPPHHLNFFNLTSLAGLLKGIGFEIIEASTPGKLDWDIAEGAIKDEKLSLGRFWDFFAKLGTAEAKTALQNWISENNLSSHMRIIAKKPLS